MKLPCEQTVEHVRLMLRKESFIRSKHIEDEGLKENKDSSHCKSQRKEDFTKEMVRRAR
jgi:hypothetical protein